MSKGKAALLLAGAGSVVGLLVATFAVITGASICGAGEAGAECYELVRTLAIRVGFVSGAMVVLMLLLVGGLLRMLSQDDRDRAERAMEAYLASRSDHGGAR